MNVRAFALVFLGCLSCAADDSNVLSPDPSKSWCVTVPEYERQTLHRAVTGVMDRAKTVIFEDGLMLLQTRTSLKEEQRNGFMFTIDGEQVAWNLSCADPRSAVREMTWSRGDLTVAMQTFSTAPRDTDEWGGVQLVRFAVTSEGDAEAGAGTERTLMLGAVNRLGKEEMLLSAVSDSEGFEGTEGIFIRPIGDSASGCRLDSGRLSCPIVVREGAGLIDFQIIPRGDWIVDRYETFDHESTLQFENAEIARFLDEIFSVHVPDRWYVEAFLASAVTMNMLRDRFGEWYLTKPGAVSYNSFWYRDAAYLAVTQDMLGLHERAAQSLRIFWNKPLPDEVNNQGTWKSSIQQKSDGRWEAPNLEWDGQGQALWALASHFRFTRDESYLADIFPAVELGHRWLTENIGLRESGHWLLPPGYGETLAEGRFVLNHNYWGVLGLKEASYIAGVAGDLQASEELSGRYEQFRSEMKKAAADAFVVDGDGGYIAPVIGGTDLRVWGSIAAAYPPDVLDPEDPMMDATLEFLWNNRAQDQYRFEDARDRIWTYITAEWAIVLLMRGEWERASVLFEGFRKQASAVFGWWEEKYLSSGKGRGDDPHGWAAAEYITWLRLMLVREMTVGGAPSQAVELLGGVPPDWYVENDPITMERVPLTIGTLNSMAVTSGPGNSRSISASFDLFDDVDPSSLRVTVRFRGSSIKSASCSSGAVEKVGDGFVVTGTDRIDCSSELAEPGN